MYSDPDFDLHVRLVSYLEASDGSEQVERQVGHLAGVPVSVPHGQAARHHVRVAYCLHLRPRVRDTRTEDSNGDGFVCNSEANVCIIINIVIVIIFIIIASISEAPYPITSTCEDSEDGDCSTRRLPVAPTFVVITHSKQKNTRLTHTRCQDN